MYILKKIIDNRMLKIFIRNSNKNWFYKQNNNMSMKSKER